MKGIRLQFLERGPAGAFGKAISDRIARKNA